MSDDDDLSEFLTGPTTFERRGFWASAPHRVEVTHFDEETGDLEFEVDHSDCPHVARYQDDDGNDIMEADCQVWWEISEGGGLLSALDLEEMTPGTYWVEGWTQRYEATPDHATEYDAGLRLCEKPEEKS